MIGSGFARADQNKKLYYKSSQRRQQCQLFIFFVPKFYDRHLSTVCNIVLTVLIVGREWETRGGGVGKDANVK
jgi:hypothetical protein